MQINIRTGKTKDILLSSIDSAILAVEIYNKPRTNFRQQTYITLMVMAWTKLFQAYFYHTIGDKYYYKDKRGHYIIVENEKRAWDLATSLKEYNRISQEKLSEPLIKNLEFFIKLRNKIEHRYITKKELDYIIFGECQALLYNYENLVVKLFGDEYSINESLVYSLQFSQYRTEEQEKASKTLMSKDIANIKKFVDYFRDNLQHTVFDSQEYSIKLIQIPKVSNTNRSDLAVEFVRWDSLNQKDKDDYDKITAIIKDKVVKKEVLNLKKYLPTHVLEKIHEATSVKLNHYDHKCLYYIFSIRPTGKDEEKEPFDTNPKFCLYDEVHKNYVFTQEWVDFLIQLISEHKLNKPQWKEKYIKKERLKIENYI